MWHVFGQIDLNQPMPQGPEMLNALATIATSVGLSSALILFFVWQGWQREQRLGNRIETLEDFSRNTLIELTKETTGALLKDAEATMACTDAIKGNTAAIMSNLDTSRKMEQMMHEHHDLQKQVAEHLAKNHSNKV